MSRDSLMAKFNKPISFYEGMLKNTITTGPETNLVEVVELMNKHNVGSIVIEEEHKAIGIITERDFLTKLYMYGAEDLKKKKVSDYMTKNPKILSNTDPMSEILKLFYKKEFRHLVIVDENKKLSSVFSVRDIVSFLIDEFSH